MSTVELPSPETIRKFVTTKSRIEKNGQTAAVETAGAATLNSKWVDITPATAATWLKNNFRNRPVSEHVVKAYARDMLAGVWQPTHQGVAFNDRDELIDGQHRLKAIVLANKTVRMMVTFGLPSKIEGSEMTTMDCVDRGRTRTVADQLKIEHGLKTGTQIAQVASALAHLCFGEKICRLSVGQTLDIYREFKAGVDFVIENRSKQTGLRSAGVLGAFAFVYDTNPATNTFFHELNLAEHIENYHRLKSLRALLTGPEGSLILSNMNRGIAELTVHVLWSEFQTLSADELDMEPANWLTAVEHFRALQQERVEKIAALFTLPKVSANAETLKTETLKPNNRRCECGEFYEVDSPTAKDFGCPNCRKANINAGVQKTDRAGLLKEQAPAPEKKERPPVEKIFLHVEHISKVSKFIITGRGSDTDINFARQLFTCAARSLGYTSEFVAYQLKKSVPQVEEWNVPSAAMTKKLKDAVEAVKSKLS